MAREEEITRLLGEVEQGRDGAMDRLMEAVYADLERVARRKLAEEYGAGLPGVTLEPAALVNESFLKLLQQRKGFRNRDQFFAIVTRVMVRVLKDSEARRGAAKRGGHARPVTLCVEDLASELVRTVAASWMDLEAWLEAIDALSALDDRKADAVRLRVFFGLTMPQVAETLGISLATAERDWTFARAWLAREMKQREERRAQDGAGPGVAGGNEGNSPPPPRGGMA
jgi:RNA polymerase sigma factor (TIGR02999 family)